MRLLAPEPRCYIVIALCLCGCSPAKPPTADQLIRVAHLPPTSKDLIEVVLRSSAVPLSIDRSCQGVGSDFNDKTIGRYISGLLAQQGTPQGKNWIQTTIVNSDPEVWQCRVIIRHVDGDDRWGWGVQFSVRRHDGVVLGNSYKCIGGAELIPTPRRLPSSAPGFRPAHTPQSGATARYAPTADRSG